MERKLSDSICLKSFLIMNLLACFALKEEAAPFRKMAAGTAAAAPAASILITGIGRRNAEKSVREFLAGHSGGASVPASRSQDAPASQARLVSSLAPPILVLTCGFAGGLNPDLKPGDVVFELSSTRSNSNSTESIRPLTTAA